MLAEGEFSLRSGAPPDSRGRLSLHELGVDSRGGYPHMTSGPDSRGRLSLHELGARQPRAAVPT
jgi:hypothetical protein